MAALRSIVVPDWNELTRDRAKYYWKKRGITFGADAEHELSGTRGHIIGNMVSFDPVHMLGRLTITSIEPTRIDCAMHVRGDYQTLTEWNRAYIELEMSIFESYLVRADERADLWQGFCRRYNRACLLWILSMGVWGDKMSAADRAAYRG